jgi:hypothetical protein
MLRTSLDSLLSRESTCEETVQRLLKRAEQRSQPKRKRSRRVHDCPRLQMFRVSGGVVEGAILDDGEQQTVLHEMR